MQVRAYNHWTSLLGDRLRRRFAYHFVVVIVAAGPVDAVLDLVRKIAPKRVHVATPPVCLSGGFSRNMVN